MSASFLLFSFPLFFLPTKREPVVLGHSKEKHSFFPLPFPLFSSSKVFQYDFFFSPPLFLLYFGDFLAYRQVLKIEQHLTSKHEKHLLMIMALSRVCSVESTEQTVWHSAQPAQGLQERGSFLRLVTYTPTRTIRIQVCPVISILMHALTARFCRVLPDRRY